MKPKREGPFVITEVLGPVTYLLLLLASWQIHNVFHAMLLRKYKENEVYGENFMEPPPELVEGEEVYEVETILNHCDSFDQQYNLNWQIIACLEIIYEILDDLEDIEIVLWKQEDISHIISPPLNPFKTIGKYC